MAMTMRAVFAREANKPEKHLFSATAFLHVLASGREGSPMRSSCQATVPLLQEALEEFTVARGTRDLKALLLDMMGDTSWKAAPRSKHMSGLSDLAFAIVSKVTQADAQKHPHQTMAGPCDSHQHASNMCNHA